MAKQLAKEAIALDPKYAFPYTVMASSPYVGPVGLGSANLPKESMRLAIDEAQKALALDRLRPLHSHWVVNLYIMQRQHDKAIASAERALAVKPEWGATPRQFGLGRVVCVQVQRSRYSI